MLTINSKVKDIIANDEAYAILHKYMPLMDREDPRVYQQAGNMSLKALLAFPATKCPRKTQQAIADELEEAEIEG